MSRPDVDLAEDATQQALLAIWRDLPRLRDPARFDAWSYRLLVRSCYAEGRRTRHWAPNLRLLPADKPTAMDGLSSEARAAADEARAIWTRLGSPPLLARLDAGLARWGSDGEDAAVPSTATESVTASTRHAEPVEGTQAI